MRESHWKAWLTALRIRVGDVTAAEIINRTKRRYADYVGTTDLPAGGLQQRQLKEHVLPLLAIYRELQARGWEPLKALLTVQALARIRFQGTRKLINWLGQLPFVFSIVRRALPWATRRLNRNEGWSIRWILANDSAMAANVDECFYREAFKRFGAPELTHVFCHLEQEMLDQTTRYVSFRRNNSLVLTGEPCQMRLKARVASRKVRTAEVGSGAAAFGGK